MARYSAITCTASCLLASNAGRRKGCARILTVPNSTQRGEPLVISQPKARLSQEVCALAAHFGKRELASKPILVLLEEAGVRVGSARQTISARLADAQLAQLKVIEKRAAKSVMGFGAALSTKPVGVVPTRAVTVAKVSAPMTAPTP